MKILTKFTFFISIIFLFLGCSAKTFPSDNRVYDSPNNYEYTYTKHIFKSFDTTPLYAYHMKTDEKSKGLIVIANGMKQNMSFRFTEWLWILDAGYDIFIFDYRSYGDSHADADLYGFIDDVQAALEYAHGIEKDKKIVLVGQSMGGTFVINALSDKKYDYLSFVVADSTFIGFDSVMSNFMMRSILLFPFFWVPYITIPNGLNADENIDYLKTPILFISGDDDLVINYKHSIELYKRTKSKKALWIVKGAGHVQSFNNLDVREEFLKVLKDNKLLFTKPQRNFLEK